MLLNTFDIAMGKTTRNCHVDSYHCGRVGHFRWVNWYLAGMHDSHV